MSAFLYGWMAGWAFLGCLAANCVQAGVSIALISERGQRRLEHDQRAEARRTQLAAELRMMHGRLAQQARARMLRGHAVASIMGPIVFNGPEKVRQVEK